MGTSQTLYEEGKNYIPGGTQLFSKRPEIFLPGYWPAYYKKAAGCKIWDIDNNMYYDMITMGIGTCILGYADKDVNNAVSKALKNGSMSSLNAPEEVELAKLLTSLHPWADMVRYARSGGEAMTIAIRIARAKTNKSKIMFCGYHGWHDWYISANLNENSALDNHLLPGLNAKGVPRELIGTTIPFTYNDAEEFIKLFEKNKSDIGVVVLEAIRNMFPKKEFVQIIQDTCNKNNIVFIVDEITSGWRLNCGGAHLLLNMEPDIAVFAKGMSNGIPMAAIVGKKQVMQAAQESFISSTYWTERMGPVAALATISKMQKLHVQQHLSAVGKKIQEGWTALAKKHNIAISVSGIYPLSHFDFSYPNRLEMKTLFTQLMLEKGFLASTVLYASYAHKHKHLDAYLAAVDDVFRIIAISIQNGNTASLLKGDVCHQLFKRLN